MSGHDVEAFTVAKENIEDDRALLNRGVIGTGTEVYKVHNLNCTALGIG